MLSILEEIFHNYRIYTSLSIGWDSQVTPVLNDRSNFLHFVGNGEPSFEFSDETVSVDIHLKNMSEVANDFEYLDRYYDLVFLSLDIEFDAQKKFFDLFLKHRTKFILLGPESKKMQADAAYMREDFYHLDKIYRLYYIDIIRSYGKTIDSKINYIEEI